jgi:hypothetical protein
MRNHWATVEKILTVYQIEFVAVGIDLSFVQFHSKII